MHLNLCTMDQDEYGIHRFDLILRFPNMIVLIQDQTTNKEN